MSKNTYDVTVRIPVGFDSAAEMAGWLERTVMNEMEEQDWTGGCAVFFRDQNNHMMMFQDGQGTSQDGFVLPHGLLDERESRGFTRRGRKIWWR